MMEKMNNLLLKTFKISYLPVACFHTSRIYQNRQSGNAMRKIMSGSSKKKKFYPETPTMPNPNTFTEGAAQGKHSINSKRATVLNKLFMRHITDLMSTGECSSAVSGYGIEINRVQITTDYKVLRIYWVARGTSLDDVIESVLEKASYQLRHELSQLRLMGMVPLIQFVQDRHYANIVEVEKRLTIADFGEDYVPPNQADKFKTQLQLMTSLEHNVKEKIEKLESEAEQLELEDEPPLPDMPQNVLGLNHAEIFGRIQRLVKKSEAPHRASDSSETWANFKVNQPVNEDPVNFGSNKSQREAFKEFVQKREILRYKARRQDRNYIPDVEYIKQELRETSLGNNFDTIEDPSHNLALEDDYIQEDIDEKSDTIVK